MKRILIILVILNSISVLAQNVKDTTIQGDSIPKMFIISSKSAAAENEVKIGFDAPVAFPSPTAASLLNLQGDDVNLYQGKVTQSFPLVDFKSYDISVPIVLNYASSGVKINEIASWVGTGWNLQAGGQISRVMKGLPDEYDGSVSKPGGGTNRAYGYIRLLEKLESEGHDPFNYMSLTNVTGTLTDAEQERLLKNAMIFDKNINEAWDTQADEFYYNFGGYSGKFVFNSNGEIISIPKNNFKITYTTGTLPSPPPIFIGWNANYSIISGFEVTTEDGTIYRFGNGDDNAVELSNYLSHNKYFYFIHKISKYYNNDFTVGTDNIQRCYLSTRPYVDENTNLSDETRIYDFPTTWYLKEIVSPKNNTVTFSYLKSSSKLIYVENQGERFQIPNFKDDPMMPNDNPRFIWPFVYAYQTLTIYKTKVTHDNIVLQSIVGSNGCRVNFNATADRQDLQNGKRLNKIQVYDNVGNLVKNYDFKYNDIHSNEPRLLKYFIGYRDTDAHTRHYYDESSLYNEWFTDVEGYKTSEESRMFLIELTESSPDGSLKKPYQFEYFDQNLPPRFSPKQDQWGYYNNDSYYPMVNMGYHNLNGEVNYPFTWAKVYEINGKDTTFGFEHARTFSSDLNKMKSGVLRTIIYPTGGSKVFEYEKNMNNYGGLRLSSVIQNFGDSKQLTTNYIYEGQDFGHYLEQYNPFKSWHYQMTFFNEDQIKMLDYNSSPGTYIPNNLGYYKVTMKNGLGKTEYHFDDFAKNADSFHPLYDKMSGAWVSSSNNIIDYTMRYTDYPFQPSVDMSWKRGLLTDIYTYSEADGTKPLRHVHNEYDYTSIQSARNWILIQGNYPVWEVEKRDHDVEIFSDEYSHSTVHAKAYFGLHPEPITKLRVRFLENFSDNYWLKKTTVKDYDMSDPGNNDKAITTVKEYIRHDSMLKPIKEISYNINSADVKIGDELQTEYRYTDAFPNNTTIKTMYEKNILSPIEVINYINIKTVGASITSYMIGNSKIFPAKSYTLKTDKPLSDYQQATSSLGLDSRLKPKANFDMYDDKGNLLQYHLENGISVSFIWAYNQSYPVAKIENIAYYNLIEALGNIGTSESDIESKSLGENDDADLMQIFNNLREEPLMKGAVITTYTYDPLVGMTTQTDANEKTIYYEYDALGRLKNARNQNKEIVKHYDYNYKLQE